MLDITELSKDEIAELCSVIGYKNIKLFFQKTEKGFRQIGKGYRPQGMSDDVICTRLYQNIKKQYVIDLFHTLLEQWKDALDEEIKKNCEESDDVALVKALSETQFNMPPALYCRLFEDGVDGRSDLLTFAVKQLKAQKRQSSGIDVVQLEEHQHQKDELDKTRAALSIAKQQWESKERELTGEIMRLNEMQSQLEQRIELLSEELRQANENSNKELDSIAVTNDALMREESAYFSKYQHTSICVVGTEMLHRYADLVDGSFQEFVADPAKRRLFGNRDRLYHKYMAHYPQGFIGLFNWNALQNRNDPNNDYIETYYDEEHAPIEIVRVNLCETLRDLVEKLKEGMPKQWHGKRVMFVFPRSTELYYGICCVDSQFIENRNVFSLKSKIVSLDAYEIGEDDILDIHSHHFLKQLHPSKFVCKVPLFDLVGIVKQKMLEHMTWAAAKAKGIQKKDWQFWKGYMADLFTDDLYAEIVETCQCSREEAELAASDLLNHAEQYLSGTDIGAELFAHIARNNAQMQEQCMELLRSEWQEQHEDLVSKIENERKTLKQISQQYQKIQQELMTMKQEIAQKEQLALDVENKITARITAAKNDAAQFISEMAFCSPMVQSAPASSDLSDWIVPGAEWKSENVDTIENTEDLIDSLRTQLLEAGVMERYSEVVAAFLFSAYIHNYPVLLAGPNGKSIADAFSITLFGKTCTSVTCMGDNYGTLLPGLSQLANTVLTVENPFCQDWLTLFIQHQESTPYKIYLHPFFEDLRIEPKEILNYMIPLFTDLFVDAVPTRRFFSCVVKKQLSLALPEVKRSSTISILRRCGLSPFVMKRISEILLDIKHLVPSIDDDSEMMLGLISVLYLNGKLDAAADQFQNQLSEDIIKTIQLLSGENI